MTDVYDTDNNKITSASEVEHGLHYALTVNQDYNETHLVLYSSHDGYGIVNAQGNFFDKTVLGNYDKLTFVVTNTTDYTWSDYHFEFWNSTFTTRGYPGLSYTSDVFTNSSYTNDGILKFWSPNWVAPGATVTFDLTLAFPIGPTDALGIRQVATTAVPVPPAALLLGSGLAMLVGFRRKWRSE